MITAAAIMVASANAVSANVVAKLERLFLESSHDFDFARTKLAVDQIIDPSIDIAVQLATIDHMLNEVTAMLPDNASDWQKVETLRRYIYQPGPWNDDKAFRYDHEDPFGLDLRNKLLSDYLQDRRGNCITMPVLFILLGQRLGLDMKPALAPLHVLVKFTDETGVTHNLEATSGAGRARDQHYRDLLPITDTALANGLYLTPLTPQQTVAVLAAVVVEDLMAQGRHEQAVEVAELLLNQHPKFAYMMVKQATAAYHLLQREFYEKYPIFDQVPVAQRARLAELQHTNQSMFDQAEALGWRPLTK